MFKVQMKDGDVQHVSEFDGGGSLVGSNEYEVHCYNAQGEFICLMQSDISRVLDEEGNDYEQFGNIYFPGHPYAQGEDPQVADTIKEAARRGTEQG